MQESHQPVESGPPLQQIQRFSGAGTLSSESSSKWDLIFRVIAYFLMVGLPIINSKSLSMIEARKQGSVSHSCLISLKKEKLKLTTPSVLSELPFVPSFNFLLALAALAVNLHILSSGSPASSLNAVSLFT